MSTDRMTQLFIRICSNRPRASFHVTGRLLASANGFAKLNTSEAPGPMMKPRCCSNSSTLNSCQVQAPLTRSRRAPSRVIGPSGTNTHVLRFNTILVTLPDLIKSCSSTSNRPATLEMVTLVSSANACAMSSVPMTLLKRKISKSAHKAKSTGLRGQPCRTPLWICTLLAQLPFQHNQC